MSIDASIANSIPMTDEAVEAFSGLVNFLNKEADRPDRIPMEMNMDGDFQTTFYTVRIANEHDVINVYITDKGKTTMVVHDPKADGRIRVILTGEFINRINRMTTVKEDSE